MRKDGFWYVILTRHTLKAREIGKTVFPGPFTSKFNKWMTEQISQSHKGTTIIRATKGRKMWKMIITHVLEAFDTEKKNKIDHMSG